MSTPLSSSEESQPDSPVPRPDPTMDSGDGFKAAAQSIRAASGIHERIASLSRSRVRRVTEYIQENLDRALTVSELAAVVCMSPYHFARLFKRSTGLPPHQFVARQRIASAVALLETQQHSMAQVSQRVGFRTVSHFTRVFRRVTGMTPGAFRMAIVRESRPGPEGGADGLA
jgi:AraC family transcriptional regulator